MTTMVTRFVGMGGMLVLTRLLDPHAYGEVTLATIVMATASYFCVYGMSQHILMRTGASPEEMFHATFYFTAVGVLGLGLTVLMGPLFGAWLGSPGMVQYLPGLAIANVMERSVLLRERVQTRLMSFRTPGLLRAGGEILFVVVTLVLAWFGVGGNALVIGTLARSMFKLVGFEIITKREDWVRPTRLNWAHTKEVFGFGVPITVAWLAAMGARVWDNLLFARYFGAGPQALYNTAYNLADIPTAIVGSSISDVLTAALAQGDAAPQRRPAVVRSLRLLMLVTAPLAIGLAAVAPAVSALFDERWSKLQGMLIALSLFAVARPLSWIGAAYLQIVNRPRMLTALEVAKAAMVVVFVWLIGDRSWLWLCVASGTAYVLNGLGFLYAVMKTEALGARELVAPLLMPVVACVPMGLAVVAFARYVHLSGVVALSAQIAVGVVVFIPSAFVIAPAAAKDALQLFKKGLLRRAQPVTST